MRNNITTTTTAIQLKNIASVFDKKDFSEAKDVQDLFMNRIEASSLTLERGKDHPVSIHFFTDRSFIIKDYHNRFFAFSYADDAADEFFESKERSDPGMIETIAGFLQEIQEKVKKNKYKISKEDRRKIIWSIFEGVKNCEKTVDTDVRLL